MMIFGFVSETIGACIPRGFPAGCRHHRLLAGGDGEEPFEFVGINLQEFHDVHVGYAAFMP